MSRGVVAVSAQAIPTTALIANGTALSGKVDCTQGRVVGIQMPAAWTAANLTFQSSIDDVTYTDLYDSSNAEYTVTTSTSRYHVISLADFVGIRYLKVRSGTTGTPVNQLADRTLGIVLLP